MTHSSNLSLGLRYIKFIELIDELNIHNQYFAPSRCLPSVASERKSLNSNLDENRLRTERRKYNTERFDDESKISTEVFFTNNSSLISAIGLEATTEEVNVYDDNEEITRVHLIDLYLFDTDRLINFFREIPRAAFQIEQFHDIITTLLSSFCNQINSWDIDSMSQEVDYYVEGIAEFICLLEENGYIHSNLDIIKRFISFHKNDGCLLIVNYMTCFGFINNNGEIAKENLKSMSREQLEDALNVLQKLESLKKTNTLLYFNFIHALKDTLFEDAKVSELHQEYLMDVQIKISASGLNEDLQ